MPDIYLVIDLAVVIALGILGLTVLLQDSTTTINKLFACFVASIGVWIIANYISNDISNPPTLALLASYFVFSFSYMAGMLFLWLTIELTNNEKAYQRFKSLMVPILLIGVLSASPFVVKGVALQGPVYSVEFGPAVGLYGIGILSAIFAGTHILRQERKRRNYLKVLYRSALFAFPALALIQFIIPVVTGWFGLMNIGILPMLILVFGFYYGVVRHGLFDIKLAAVRSAAYLLSLSALGGLYYLAAYFISTIIFKGQAGANFNVNFLNIFLALGLAFIFQPVKRFFDRITNKIFYRNGYDTGDFLIRLGRILTSTTELREILDQVGNEIRSTLKASGSLFLIYRDHHPNELAGEGISKQFNQSELATLQAITSASEGGLLTVDKLITSKLPHAQALHALLTKKHIVYILPLVTADETIGYFMLGENLAGMYTKQDTEALKAIANELVIAVQNARSVQAIRDLNASLEERIDSATEELRASNKKLIELDEAKDEFVSMASHQLRTPLTSVKGYISMVLEGDTGDITPMQRKLLEEAFASSERMVHLISDFLNVSRLQTGKFVIDTSKVDLAELVGQEVAGLEATAKVRSLKLQYRKPKYFPVLYIDEGKIRQVLMNFIDNAIYYSTERTTITVKLRVEDGDAVLEVHDTGIGVPKSEQQRLFTKFFRATNARRQRPDGTGIGLFLAKKVIVAHGGSMVFESTEGEGSVFGFRLPIKKLSEAPPAHIDLPL